MTINVNAFQAKWTPLFSGAVSATAAMGVWMSSVPEAKKSHSSIHPAYMAFPEALAIASNHPEVAPEQIEQALDALQAAGMDLFSSDWSNVWFGGTNSTNLFRQAIRKGSAGFVATLLRRGADLDAEMARTNSGVNPFRKDALELLAERRERVSDTSERQMTDDIGAALQSWLTRRAVDDVLGSETNNAADLVRGLP